MGNEDEWSLVEFHANRYWEEDYEYFCNQEAQEFGEKLKSHSGKKSLTIDTKLAGVTFEDRQSVCEKLYEGAKLLLVREPENIYDPNAIGVLFEGQKCGYIPKVLAKEIVKNDSGIKLEAVVTGLIGGGDLSIGVNIRIQEKIENNSKESSEKRISSKDVKKWIDEKDQSEFTEEQVRSAFDLTDEQKEIVAQDLSGNSTMKIIAFAGTGKTATLLEYSKSRPSLRFLYVAFNRSVRQEAKTKFPSNVTCRTSHSLAWSEFGAPHGHRLPRNLKLSIVKKILRLDNYMEARIVTETFANFLISADAQFSKVHLPWLPEQERRRPTFYLEMAVKLWIMMCDPNNHDIRMLHDGYLKQYQLSKPELNYDCILLDEAQDTNPVVTDIILSQDCPKILVGDPHQQIYAFRGAQDAMQKIKTDKTFYLTYSFRFGEEIAWIANKILHTFKNEKQSLKGFRPKNSNEEAKDLAIISRTNASVLDQAVAHCENHKISFLGGIDGYRFNDIIDVYLLDARNNSEIRNPFIRSFPIYSAMKAYAEEAQDWEMKSNCRVVEKYQDRIPSLIEKIKASAVDRLDSDVVLTTSHKAKGSQFSKIQLCDDFQDLFAEGQLIDPKAIDPEEFNLLYVTVTRAKDFVDFSSPHEWSRFVSFNRSPGYEKILDFFGLAEDRTTPVVSEPENDFSHSLLDNKREKEYVNYAFKIVGYLVHDNKLFDRRCPSCKGMNMYSSREYTQCPKCSGELTHLISADGKSMAISEGTIYPAFGLKQEKCDAATVANCKNGIPPVYRFRLFEFMDEHGVLTPPQYHDECRKGAKVEILTINHQLVPSRFLAKDPNDPSGENKVLKMELMINVYTAYGDYVKVLTELEYANKTVSHSVNPDGSPAPLHLSDDAQSNNMLEKRGVNYAFKIVGYLVYDNRLFDRICPNCNKLGLHGRFFCVKCRCELTYITSADGKPMAISQGTIYPTFSPEQEERDAAAIAKCPNGMAPVYKFRIFSFMDEHSVLNPPPEHYRCRKGVKVEVLTMNHQLIPSWFVTVPKPDGTRDIKVKLMMQVYTNYGDKVTVLTEAQQANNMISHPLNPDGTPTPFPDFIIQ